MQDVGKVALSSLAIGASAATMLGVTELAKGQSGSSGCYFGQACTAAWHNEYEGILGDTWALDPYQIAQIDSMFAMEASSYWVYGTCSGVINETHDLCGCDAVAPSMWAMVAVYGGNAYVTVHFGHKYYFTDGYSSGCRIPS
jgi:hypothetical protein